MIQVDIRKNVGQYLTKMMDIELILDGVNFNVRIDGGIEKVPVSGSHFQSRKPATNWYWGRSRETKSQLPIGESFSKI